MPPEQYSLNDTQLLMLLEGHDQLGLADARATAFPDIARTASFDEDAARRWRDAALESGPIPFEPAAAPVVHAQPLHGLDFNRLTAA